MIAVDDSAYRARSSEKLIQVYLMVINASPNSPSLDRFTEL